MSFTNRTYIYILQDSATAKFESSSIFNQNTENYIYISNDFVYCDMRKFCRTIHLKNRSL